MVEDVLKEMKNVLRDYLDAEIDRQDGHAGDGVITQKISEKAIILGDQTPPNYGLPAIVLRANGSSQELFATGKKDVVYSMSIAAAVTDTDEERSLKKLWRTLRAIETVMETQLSGRLNIVDYQTDNISYSASVFNVAEDTSVEKGGIIEASVKERQDAYTSAQV